MCISFNMSLYYTGLLGFFFVFFLGGGVNNDTMKYVPLATNKTKTTARKNKIKTTTEKEEIKERRERGEKRKERETD